MQLIYIISVQWAPHPSLLLMSHTSQLPRLPITLWPQYCWLYCPKHIRYLGHTYHQHIFTCNHWTEVPVRISSWSHPINDRSLFNCDHNLIISNLSSGLICLISSINTGKHGQLSVLNKPLAIVNKKFTSYIYIFYHLNIHFMNAI